MHWLGFSKFWFIFCLLIAQAFSGTSVCTPFHGGEFLLPGFFFGGVKGFTPLCLTWAVLVGDGLVATLLWIPPEV